MIAEIQADFESKDHHDSKAGKKVSQALAIKGGNQDDLPRSHQLLALKKSKIRSLEAEKDQT